MSTPAMTLAEAARAMTPPMPRRELARRMKDVRAVGAVYGRRGRRAATYPVADILRAHTEWLRDHAERRGSLADLDGTCQNSAQDQSAHRSPE